MKTSGPLILVVEHNAAMLSNLRRLLQSRGYRIRTFFSLGEIKKLLLETDSPSCAIVDLDLPGRAGLAVQNFLRQTHPGVPVIFISAHPDVPSSVMVMKAGALDLLVRPFDAHKLLKVVGDAVVQERQYHKELDELLSISERLDSLTRRETQVLECLLRGLLNKQSAAELGIAEKTIKVHSGRIMKKMRIRSIAELVQLVMRFRSGRSLSRRSAWTESGWRDGPLAN